MVKEAVIHLFQNKSELKVALSATCGLVDARGYGISKMIFVQLVKNIPKPAPKGLIVMAITSPFVSYITNNIPHYIKLFMYQATAFGDRSATVYTR